MWRIGTAVTWLCVLFPSVVLSHAVPTYSSLAACSVVPVNSEEELLEDYSEWLQKHECVLFHLVESNTFLTRKQDRFWDLAEPISGLMSASPRTAGFFGLGSFFTKKNTQWVEFYYDEHMDITEEKLIPVSLCHSEMEGEGGTISMQVVANDQRSLAGSFGVDVKVQALALTTTTKLTFADARSAATTISCEIQHGEIGQLFLSRARYLRYTPWFRIRTYNPDESTLEATTPFAELPEAKRVLKGGFGDWVCGTSSVMNLQCFSLRDAFIV